MLPDLANWKSNGQYFDYRGHSIFDKIEGAGRPLVLLHGFLTNS
jgi:hypothetical protein